MPESEKNEPNVSDRQILMAIYESQARTEQMVTEFIDQVRPMAEKFSKRGMLGLLGSI